MKCKSGRIWSARSLDTFWGAVHINWTFWQVKTSLCVYCMCVRTQCVVNQRGAATEDRGHCNPNPPPIKMLHLHPTSVSLYWWLTGDVIKGHGHMNHTLMAFTGWSRAISLLLSFCLSLFHSPPTHTVYVLLLKLKGKVCNFCATSVTTQNYKNNDCL